MSTSRQNFVLSTWLLRWLTLCIAILACFAGDLLSPPAAQAANAQDDSTSAILEAAQNELKAQLATGNRDAIGQAVMKVSNVYHQVVDTLSAARNYTVSERYLSEWKEFLNNNGTHLSANGISLSTGYYHNSSGLIFHTRAMADYYLNTDYINARPLFEKSEAHFEEAKRAFKGITPPPSDTGFQKLCEDFLRDTEANMLNARGMKLFTLGEFELESGALERASSSLEKAVEAMKSAKSTMSEASRNAAPDFICYATATLKRAASDMAMLTGNLSGAAQAELERAAALEECQAMFARASVATAQLPTAEYFTRRFAKDAYVAKERHDRFMAAVMAIPQFVWAQSFLFVVLAMTPLAALMYLKREADWIKDPMLIFVCLCYFFVVAGIGSGLTNWEKGANWFSDSIDIPKKTASTQ